MNTEIHDAWNSALRSLWATTQATLNNARSTSFSVPISFGKVLSALMLFASGTSVSTGESSLPFALS